MSYPQIEILKISDTFFSQCTLCTRHQLMAKGYFRIRLRFTQIRFLEVVGGGGGLLKRVTGIRKGVYCITQFFPLHSRAEFRRIPVYSKFGILVYHPKPDFAQKMSTLLDRSLVSLMHCIVSFNALISWKGNNGAMILSLNKQQ